MNFYRLIKPDWAKPTLKNGEPNPKFTRHIGNPGDYADTYDGVDFSPEYIQHMNELGFNVYFFPNKPSVNVYAVNNVKYLAGRHIDTFEYVFVDMDLKDGKYQTKDDFYEKLKQFEVTPTIVVDSGNGVHAYWAIDKLTRDEYVYTQLALIRHFNTDDSIFTVLQLMRLPNSLNTKIDGQFKRASIIEEVSSNSVYNLDSFPNYLFENLTDDDRKRGQSHLDRLDGKLTIDTSDFIGRLDQVPESFVKFINDPKNEAAKSLWENPKGPPYNDRSKSDMALANILYKSGFEKSDTYAVIYNSQKALTHANRSSYTDGTVSKVYGRQKAKEKCTINISNDMINNIKQKLGIVTGANNGNLGQV